MKQIAGLSPVLFHRTGTRAAANIMRTDRFELKPSEGTEAEQKFSQSYYLSTARSPNSAYIMKGASSQSVVFELDGVKLAQKFKGSAIDYWGPDYYKYGDATGNHDLRSERFEAEDRIYSKDKFLPASKYIKAVYAMAKVGTERNHSTLASLYDLKKFCMLRKVPIYFFDDHKALIQRNKNKAVPFKPEKPGPDPDAYVHPREHLEYEAKNPRRKTDYLSMWYALYKIPKKPGVESYLQLKSIGNERLLTIYRRLQYSDAIQSFSADLHNAKSTAYGTPSKEREHLDNLIDVMRKERQTPKQWLDALKNKWYPLYPDGSSSQKNYASLSGNSGVYVSVALTKASEDLLKNWLQEHVLNDWTFTNEGNLHCTIMYSLAPAYNWVQQTRVTRARALGFDLFGPDNNTLVVRLWSPELSERNAAWRSYGCVPTYPDYKPHITISFKTEIPDNAKDLIAAYNDKLRSKPLYLEFDPEVAEDLED